MRENQLFMFSDVYEYRFRKYLYKLHFSKFIEFGVVYQRYMCFLITKQRPTLKWLMHENIIIQVALGKVFENIVWCIFEHNSLFCLSDDAQQSQEKTREGEGLNLIKVMNDESFHHQTSRVVPRRKFHLMSNGENLPTIATFWNNLWAWMMGAWRRRRRRMRRRGFFSSSFDFSLVVGFWNSSFLKLMLLVVVLRIEATTTTTESGTGCLNNASSSYGA